ncbi:hypothetical protein D3C73_926640 [compost metagenome]
MRLGDIADLLHRPRPHLATGHAQRFKYPLAHQLVIRLATSGGSNLTGNDVHQVVVGVTAAEAGDRLQVCQPGDDVAAGEGIGFGPQHQVAGTQAEAAVVDQQIAYLQVFAHPWVMHAECRQMALHRIVPAQLALLHQRGQQRGGHRLAVGGDLEQRVLVDAAAVTAHSFGVAIDHLAILDHRHRQPRQVLMLVHESDVGIQACRIHRPCRGGGGKQHGEGQQAIHGRSPLAAPDNARHCTSSSIRSSRSPPAGCSAGPANGYRWRRCSRGTGQAALRNAGAR